jgi:alanyl-tRNA synthetase
MTSKEIRQSFLDFFKSKNHKIVQSAPVIPHGDPTLLFTNAGMNQFKDVFLGSGKRDYTRVADTQKCIRVSGKHNDLEEVGFDTYHHTFFEMLGNWSFGDYYKAEAIEWAWELLTGVWKLDKNRLYATVYRTDDEAYEIWKRYLPDSNIFRFDEKDNFWEMGETGPCGPCSEIHYDRTPDCTGAKLVNTGKPEVIEIWNLVFIQYNRRQDGTLDELSAKHVDTGMGFERICAVIQGKDSNYDTDIFMPLINEIEKLSGKKYNQSLSNPLGIAMKVMADHIRTLAFAIADGAIPGNEGRGYVLRRILRRASRFARNLDIKEAVLYKLVPTLVDIMSDVFPELRTHQDIIVRIVKAEEENFLQTLDRGLEKFDEIRNKLSKSDSKKISGADSFQLYDTYGFPYDLTELLARENGLFIEKSEFDLLMEEQRNRSRKARKSVNQEVEMPAIKEKSVFTGYDELVTEAKVLYVYDNQIVLDRTPFYVESGGQVSDTGTITVGGNKYIVNDVRKFGDAIVHFCDTGVEPLIGSTSLAEVDADRRRSIMRNHSATHLLHEALRQILGEHLKQAGSLVAPDYMRFDFNHFEKVSSEHLKKIESIVNRKIFENIDVNTDVISLDEARKNPKIKMFFGDKYGEIVRVVSMDKSFSRELCGGTHVKNTSEIGFFKIVSESSIAAGVRRIEAITGKTIEDYIHNEHEKVEELQNEKQNLLEQIKQLEKELTNHKMGNFRNLIPVWIDGAKVINGIKVVSQVVNVDDNEQLRLVGENLRDSMGAKGIGLLSSEINNKLQIAALVTDDLIAKYPAGTIVNLYAKKFDGSGGGKPHLATAGTKDVSKLSDIVRGFTEFIEEMFNEKK